MDSYFCEPPFQVVLAKMVSGKFLKKQATKRKNRQKKQPVVPLFSWLA